MKKIIPFSLTVCLSHFAVAADEGTNIIITSSRIAEPLEQVATSVTIIEQEEIEGSGYTNISDLLRTIASVGVSNAGGEGKPTSLRIRGEEGYRTLVMIDGIDIADPTGTQVMPQVQHLLLNGDVERIEILRGSQGFIYGADAGGVVNIFTPRGQEISKLNIKLEAGSFGSQRLNTNISGLIEQFDYFFSLGKNESDGFDAKKTEDSNDKDGYENTTIHSKLGYSLNDSSRLQLVLRDVQSESEFDGCFLGFTEIDVCENNYDQTTGKLSYDFSSEQISQHLAYSYSDINRESFSDADPAFSTEGVLSRAEYWGSFNKGDLSIIYGVDLEKEKVRPNTENEIKRDQVGIYSEIKLKLLDELFLSAGIRQDDNDDFDVNISKRLSMAYVKELDKYTIKYRASYGTGFRAPSLSEIAYNSGEFAFGAAADTILKEEFSEGIDLGLDFIFSSGMLFKATLFDQVIEDEIYFDLEGFSGYLQDTGDTQSKGVELEVELPINNNINFYSNYTYNETKDINGDQRIRRPKHLGNIGFQYFGSNNKLTLRTNIRISKDAVDGSARISLKDYELVDFSAIYDFTNQFSFFVNIKNVFDEDYEEIVNFNTSGRIFNTGLRYRF